MELGKTTRQLLGDARQGIVGGLAFLIVTAMGAVAIGGQIPAWTLFLTLAVALLPAALVITGMARRREQLTGAWSCARHRRETMRQIVRLSLPGAHDTKSTGGGSHFARSRGVAPFRAPNRRDGDRRATYLLGRGRHGPRTSLVPPLAAFGGFSRSETGEGGRRREPHSPR